MVDVEEVVRSAKRLARVPLIRRVAGLVPLFEALVGATRDLVEIATDWTLKIDARNPERSGHTQSAIGMPAKKRSMGSPRSLDRSGVERIERTRSQMDEPAAAEPLSTRGRGPGRARRPLLDHAGSADDGSILWNLPEIASLHAGGRRGTERLHALARHLRRVGLRNRFGRVAARLEALSGAVDRLIELAVPMAEPTRNSDRSQSEEGTALNEAQTAAARDRRPGPSGRSDPHPAASNGKRRRASVVVATKPPRKSQPEAVGGGPTMEAQTGKQPHQSRKTDARRVAPNTEGKSRLLPKGGRGR